MIISMHRGFLVQGDDCDYDKNDHNYDFDHNHDQDHNYDYDYNYEYNYDYGHEIL